jgi:hypothetical protein
MLLMDDVYDPDDVLMDPDTQVTEFTDLEDAEEIDFENPLSTKMSYEELTDEIETETIRELFY